MAYPREELPFGLVDMSHDEFYAMLENMPSGANSVIDEDASEFEDIEPDIDISDDSTDSESNIPLIYLRNKQDNDIV